MAYDDRCKFFEIRIVKVMDGDSIRADLSQGFSDWKMSQEFRLMGIDTNETRRGGGRTLEDVHHGKLAKTYLRGLLEVGEIYVVQTHKKEKGKYGRWLSTIWRGRVNVNKLMVRKHLAVEYHGQRKADVMGAHRACIRKLKELGKWEK
tara:strand:+ start:125 stop:568 length:444 start_codon:yes stop_codon:yes gene_type:complete